MTTNSKIRSRPATAVKRGLRICELFWAVRDHSQSRMCEILLNNPLIEMLTLQAVYDFLMPPPILNPTPTPTQLRVYRYHREARDSAAEWIFDNEPWIDVVDGEMFEYPTLRMLCNLGDYPVELVRETILRKEITGEQMDVFFVGGHRMLKSKQGFSPIHGLPETGENHEREGNQTREARGRRDPLRRIKRRLCEGGWTEVR